MKRNTQLYIKCVFGGGRSIFVFPRAVHLRVHALDTCIIIRAFHVFNGMWKIVFPSLICLFLLIFRSKNVLSSDELVLISLLLSLFYFRHIVYTRIHEYCFTANIFCNEPCNLIFFDTLWFLTSIKLSTNRKKYLKSFKYIFKGRRKVNLCICEMQRNGVAVVLLSQLTQIFLSNIDIFSETVNDKCHALRKTLGPTTEIP